MPYRFYWFQGVGFYRLYGFGSTGSMVLKVPGFYRFYGSTGSRVMVLQVPGF